MVREPEGSSPRRPPCPPRIHRAVNQEALCVAAAEIVAGDAVIVVVAGLVRRVPSGLFDPVEQRSRRSIDERVIGCEIVLLAIALDDALGLDEEPGFPLLAVVVLPGRVFAADNLQAVVTTISVARDVGGTDIEDFRPAQASITHHNIISLNNNLFII
jgi:hypothetical protein